ncbi:MAG: hypothetical protein OXQ28_05560 [Acidobacteriota bacterium]|nr:hypothetical protein [Acidobacteriota bacterium]
MSEARVFENTPPDTLGLAIVLMGLIRSLADSGTLDGEDIAALSARVERAISAPDINEAFREKLLQVTRYVLPGDLPHKSQP